MQGLRAFNFLSAAAVVILSMGGCPQPAPQTAVLGEQEIAEDPFTPNGGDSSLSPPQSLTIDNIIVTGSLVRGQVCVFSVSCTVSDPGGVVQAVSVDLSPIGGPKGTMFRMPGNLWVWSGVVTATIAGPAAIYFVATSDSPIDSTPVAIQTADVRVTPIGTGNPDGTPTDDLFGQEGENVALGKTYTWNLRPNSPYCSDSGDQTQLTDGVTLTGWSLQSPRVPPSVTKWILEQPSTVGWYDRGPIIITIDLSDDGDRQIYPIKGVACYAAAGTGRVGWPVAIDVQVSSDGLTFYRVGDLVELSAAAHGEPPAYGEYATHCYWTDELRAYGRYLRLVIGPNPEHPCTVIDEIRVIRRSDETINASLSGEAVAGASSTLYVQSREVRYGIRRRILADAEEVRRLAQLAGRPELEVSLSGIIAQARNLDGLDLFADREATYWNNAGDTSQYRAILPLNSLHRQVFRVLAALWRAQGVDGIVAWQASLWDPLGLITAEAPPAIPPAVSIVAMRNEYRAGAFNLSNATASDRTVSVSIEGLPGGTNPPYIRIHAVPWTDAVLPSVPPNYTVTGKPLAAALAVVTPGPDGFPVRIPSGMTTQVWLTFHVTDVAPGVHSGQILVEGQAVGTVHLRMSALEFPAQPTLSLGGWDHSDLDNAFGMTPENRDRLVTHLREHFVDTAWGTVYSMQPTPVPSDPAKRAQYFSRFDKWVARWRGTPGLPDTRHYRIHMSGEVNSFNGHTPGSSGFRVGVGQWIREWARHWQDMGLRPNQVALLIVDEPNEKRRGEDTIRAWAMAIRDTFEPTEERPLIWEDPTYTNPAAANAQGILEVSDIICPHRLNYMTASNGYRGVYQRWLQEGQALVPRRQLNFYSAEGPSHGLDPCSYYRLQAWTCWKEGASAMFFWAFADNGGSSWNPYVAPRNYEPLYIDGTTVTTAKHMEAIREGVEDYEYLVMLQNRIAELKATGSRLAEVSQAETLLNEAANWVLDKPGGWSWPSDDFAWHKPWNRATPDEVRIEILDMLEALE